MTSFQVDFPAAMVADLRERINRTRWLELPFDRGWERGVDHQTLLLLARYWADDYDFDKSEEELNRLDHGIEIVDGMRIHYVIYRGTGERRIPVLLLHGWPGSFVESIDAARLLVQEQREGLGFDLIVPSLPGFAFSDPPNKPGMHGGVMAQLMHQLMTALGYERYGVQGGDWGAVIATALALQHPESVVGLHLNLIPSPPRAPEGTTASDAEREHLAFRDEWEPENLGYYHIQASRPQTLAYAQHDSPVGLLAWIVEKLWAWSDHDGDLWSTFDRDRVLTNAMLYWLPGRVLSAASIYYEMNHSDTDFLAGRVEVPTGYARFPKEPWGPPRDMVERKWNLVHYTEPPRGGHFAAMEQPELFAADVAEFFRSL